MAYASKYYDPVKAHEYYEKHKQLKGRQSRTSTKGLSEEGKATAKYVKEQIAAERKEWNNRLKETMQQRIKELKEQLKGKSKEERAEAIRDLREKFKSIKQQAKEAFDEKYAQEMDKIKADPKFKAVKKRVSRKK